MGANLSLPFSMKAVSEATEALFRGLLPGGLVALRVSKIRCQEPDCWPRRRGESVAWLNALPVSSLGTLLDYESFRVAIALRVGADVYIPHSCRCGGRKDSICLHGLSCKYNASRFPKHSAVNDVVKQSIRMMVHDDAQTLQSS